MFHYVSVEALTLTVPRFGAHDVTFWAAITPVGWARDESDSQFKTTTLVSEQLPINGYSRFAIFHAATTAVDTATFALEFGPSISPSLTAVLPGNVPASITWCTTPGVKAPATHVAVTVILEATVRCSGLPYPYHC
jgi:hypothetical protein